MYVLLSYLDKPGRQQTASIRQQTADSRQQTADSRQQTADSRQRQEAAGSSQQTVDAHVKGGMFTKQARQVPLMSEKSRA